MADRTIATALVAIQPKLDEFRQTLEEAKQVLKKTIEEMRVIVEAGFNPMLGVADGTFIAIRRSAETCFSGIRSMAESAAGMVGSAFGSMREMLGSMFSVAGGNLLLDGIEGMFGGIREKLAGLRNEIMQSSDQYEQLMLRFTQLLQSEDAATDLMKKISDLSIKAPFQIPDLANATQTLLTFGMDSKKAFELVQLAGDAAAASPRGMKEGLSGITQALGKMSAMGTVTRRELLMLVTQGVPAIEYLSKALGTNAAGALAQVHAGAVSSKVAIAAMAAGMETDFAGMMNKQSRTWSGLGTTLADIGQRIARIGGEPIFGFAKRSLQEIVDLLGGVTGDQLASGLRVFSEYLVQIAEFARGTLASAFQGIREVWDSISVQATEAWGVIQEIGRNVIDMTGSARGFGAGLVTAMKTAAGATMEWALTLLDYFSILTNSANTFWDVLSAGATYAGTKIRTTLLSIWESVKTELLSFWDLFEDHAKAAFMGFYYMAERLVKLVGKQAAAMASDEAAKSIPGGWTKKDQLEAADRDKIFANNLKNLPGVFSYHRNETLEDSRQAREDADAGRRRDSASVKAGLAEEGAMADDNFKAAIAGARADRDERRKASDVRNTFNQFEQLKEFFAKDGREKVPERNRGDFDSEGGKAKGRTYTLDHLAKSIQNSANNKFFEQHAERQTAAAEKTAVEVEKIAKKEPAVIVQGPPVWGRNP